MWYFLKYLSWQKGEIEVGQNHDKNNKGEYAHYYTHKIIYKRYEQTLKGWKEMKKEPQNTKTVTYYIFT